MRYVVSSVYSYLHCHMFNAVIFGKDTKKFSNNKRFYSNFNFVKLCHDLANQASMLALAAPSFATLFNIMCNISTSGQLCVSAVSPYHRNI